jgi:hypothetical protein
MKSYLIEDHPEALALVQEFVERVTQSIADDYEAYGHDVNDVLSESVPGFIPFTDGGWDGVAHFSLYGEAANAMPEMKSFLESDYKFAQEEFRREHDLADDAIVFDHDEWEDWLTEWEQGDDGCFVMKVRALMYSAENHRNETGQDEVILCVGFNDDFGYGRDHVGAWAGNAGTHWKWERTIPLADVTEELLAECEKEALAAL